MAYRIQRVERAVDFVENWLDQLPGQRREVTAWTDARPVPTGARKTQTL
jgi:hypothetical protein